MADQNDTMIHDIIDSIQTSIDIADQTSRKKYNFSVSQLEVTMSLDFDLKVDDSKSKSTKAEHKHGLHLFSRNNDPIVNSSHDDSGDRHAKMTLRMVFKPGGKALENMAPGSDDSSQSTSSDSDDSDTDSDADSDSNNSDDDY